MKKINNKNYIILTLIIITTILASLYILSWYRQYNDTKLSNSVITETLTEVKYDNLDSILQERDFLIVYMCTTSESICRNFEAKFNDYITDNNLNSDIVYLSLGLREDENNYLTKIYNKYKSNHIIKKINKYPTLLIFSEGKIIDILTSDNKTITIGEVEQFLKGYDL